MSGLFVDAQAGGGVVTEVAVLFWEGGRLPGASAGEDVMERPEPVCTCDRRMGLSKKIEKDYARPLMPQPIPETNDLGSC